MWFNDEKWRDAANAALRISYSFDWILTPQEFHGLSEKFRPIEYSESPPAGRIAFLCHKDRPDVLSSTFRSATASPDNYFFANEVFALGAPGVVNPAKDEIISEHLKSWLFTLQTKQDLPIDRNCFHTEFLNSEKSGGKRALVIGATKLGNTGDDLLGEAAANLLLETGDYASVHLASFDLKREDLKNYDSVFVGPGGILYSAQSNIFEWQNLANYFKFPFWCSDMEIPCHLIGVGHQEFMSTFLFDPPTKAFLTKSLGHFESISTRDQETASLIRKMGCGSIAVGADLAFSVVQRLPDPLRSPSEKARGILFIGEIFKYPAITALLGMEGGPRLDETFSPLAFALMSNDDLPHWERLQIHAKEKNTTFDLHDFRSKSAEEIIGVIREFGLLVTTRFHGLVLGAIAGAKILAFDQNHGKKDRLIRSVFPELQGQLFYEDSLPDALIGLLASGSIEHLASADSANMLAHAMTISNHRPQKAEERPASSGALPNERKKEIGERLLNEAGEIRLCWAASSEGSNDLANLGDGLSAFIIANLAGLPIRHTNFEEDSFRMFGVGSIGHAARHGHAVIWGTGCYRPDKMVDNVPNTTYDVLAVRGNISQQCLESVGIRAPKCYGEPVWLLPSMFQEKVEKKYELGVITHISDLKTAATEVSLKGEWSCFEIPDLLKPEVVVINTWHPPTLEGMFDKLRLILSCKRIASRSFHGTVIAEAYGIPCIPICSKPGVPVGTFTSDEVEMALLDRRIHEFLNSGARQKQYFYGQRRKMAMKWDHLIQEIDKVWTPIGYDATPMLEAFPFEIPSDPLKNKVPLHASLRTTTF